MALMTTPSWGVHRRSFFPESDMKSVSTGFGLCALACAVVVYPVMDRLLPSSVGSKAAAAVPAMAATRGVEPTIVWYGCVSGTTQYYPQYSVVFRAWSNGRVEMMRVQHGVDTVYPCNTYTPCVSGWIVLSDPEQGYAAAADINFDQVVDGTDLGLLLGKWGDAPRHEIPPSDCPLNLINP